MHSHHLSDFLKSLSILYVTQEREPEAEVALARMDRLRNCRSPKVTLISDLQWLIPAQLAVEHYADANENVKRLASLDEWHFQSVGRANVDDDATTTEEVEHAEVEEVITSTKMHFRLPCSRMHLARRLFPLKRHMSSWSLFARQF